MLFLLLQLLAPATLPPLLSCKAYWGVEAAGQQPVVALQGQQQVGYPVVAATRLEEPVALLLDERRSRKAGPEH